MGRPGLATPVGCTQLQRPLQHLYPLEIQGTIPEKGEKRPENVKDNRKKELFSDASVNQEGGIENGAYSQPSWPRQYAAMQTRD